MPQQKIVEETVYLLRDLDRRFEEEKLKVYPDPEFGEIMSPYWDDRVRQVERVISQLETGLKA